MEKKEDENVPLVSVCVITYNHEEYIRQCLDSILMQNVNFPYEILIHDDASPDGTADIIREYEAKYPGVIKPIYQTENQYSQGKSVEKFNLERARGKYLAFCEGDDYWTDPGKLQKQVDYLEEHLEYIAYVHRVRTIDEFGNVRDRRTYDTLEYTISDAENIFTDCGCAGPTCSLVCRNIFLTLPKDIHEKFLNCNSNGDSKLFLLLTLNGTICRFNDVMSVYRRITSKGYSWTARHANKNNCLFSFNCINELAQFSQKSYGFTPNYTDRKNELALISIYKFITKINKNNWNIMCKLLNATNNKSALIIHIIKFRKRIFNELLKSRKKDSIINV